MDGGGAASESSEGEAGRDLREILEGCECNARFFRCEAEDFEACREPPGLGLGRGCSRSSLGGSGSVWDEEGRGKESDLGASFGDA